MTGPARLAADAQVQVVGSPVLVREIVGNGFGLVSALLGLRRLVWAWPVGMVGNGLLFTVFLGGVFATPQAHDLYGQAGRQVFFFAVSVYGWWRWSRNRRHGAGRRGGQPPLGHRPGTAGPAGSAAVVGTALGYPRARRARLVGSVPDAWILTGSLLATYGMARGWVEFWLVWIAVDAVGVPLLLRGGFYPSAAMYLVYGALCVWGFAAWWRTLAGRPPGVRTDPAHLLGGRGMSTRGHARPDRAGGRGHRRRPAGRRRRRRGPGERGRPDLRRRAGHPGAARVHGPLHLRRTSASR